MNCYATLPEVKRDLGLSSVTTHDTDLLALLEAASRELDAYCMRWFYVEEGTRYQTPARVDGRVECPLDADLLEIDTLTTDSEVDGSYDGETLTEDTDFWAWPYNSVPKTRLIMTSFGTYGWTASERYVKVVGSWGFGDGRRAIPTRSVAGVLTADDATETTVDVDDATGIEAGQTLLVESEQLFVSAVSGLELTVERGVNGTTAAAHAAKAVAIYEYPADIARFTRWLAATEFKIRATGGIQQERMGDYFYTRLPSDVPQSMLRCLGPYRRSI